jgi:hypothetical protein
VRWLREQFFLPFFCCGVLLLKKSLTFSISVEPIESELDKQVEYDMDEQGIPFLSFRSPAWVNKMSCTDKEWLDALNVERRKEGIDPLTYEFFEIVMDRLEKEWFDLVCTDFLTTLYVCVSEAVALYRQNKYRNLQHLSCRKTRGVLFVTTANARIPTQSYFVTVVIWLFIRVRDSPSYEEIYC